MKKKLALLLGVFLTISAVAFTVGCGDELEEVPNKVTIEVGVMNTQSELSIMNRFKSEFEKVNDQIHIVVTPFPSVYAQAMATYIRDPENMPDVLWVPGDQHQAFTSAGHFLDLAPYFERDNIDLDAFYPTMLENTHSSSTDESIWFAPRDYNKPVTFVNKAIFEAAGIDFESLKGVDENGDPVWDWDKFIEVCKTLREAMDTNTDSTTQRLGLTKNAYPIDTDLTWSAVMHSVMGELAGEEVDGEFVPGQLVEGDQFMIDSEANMDAYKKLYPYIRDRLFINPSTDSRDYFLNRGAAMWFAVRPKLTDCIGAGLDVDFLPMPTRSVVAGCSGYGISKQAAERVSDNIVGNTKTNAEYAWDFIKWIISKEGQEVFGAMGAGVPVLKELETTGSWLNYEDPDLNHEAFVAYQERDISSNVFGGFDPQYNTALYSELNNLMVDVSRKDTWEGSPIETAASVTGNYNNLNSAIAERKQKLLDIVS